MAADASPTQIFNFYYTLINDVISKENSSGIQDVGALLKQFPGKEYQVYVQICRKGGVEPKKKPTIKELANHPSNKVSSWLIKKGFKVYSELQAFLKMKWEIFLTISTEEQLKELGVAPEDTDNLLRFILSESCQTEKKVELPERNQDQKELSSNFVKPEQKLDFEVGESCYTRVLKPGDKDGEDLWVSARITNINKHNSTFDIFVLNAKAHGVPPEAVNVPRSFLKKSTDHVQVAVPEPRAAVVPKYNTGDRIRVVGLRSHTLYNGQCGTIQLHMAKSKRYQVRLDTGDVFAIRNRNISPELVELPKEALEVGIKNIRKAGMTSQAQEDALVELMEKLFRSSPSMDHIKFGEFAAGFFITKQKIISDQGKLSS